MLSEQGARLAADLLSLLYCRADDRLSRRIMDPLCDVPPGAEWRKVQCPELDRLPELLLCPGGRGF